MIEQIEINQSILNRFSILWASERLAHAYLFIGPDFSGKTTTALAVAKLINCDSNKNRKKKEPCGHCPSCIKIESGNHPDLSILDIEEGAQSIKIAAIRELVGKSQLRPFEAQRKIFIIRNVDKLTPEGSNALLKTLEEPSQSSILILTTSSPESILSTVRSRCHAIQFFPLPQESIEAQLRKGISRNKEECHYLSYFSEGCLGKALFLGEKGFFKKKNEYIDNLVFDRENENYIKQLLLDKEQTKEALDVLFSWFRDLLLMKTEVEEQKLMNLDRAADLKQMIQKYSFGQLQDILNEIINTKRLLDGNFNVRIPLILLREKIWIR